MSYIKYYPHNKLHHWPMLTSMPAADLSVSLSLTSNTFMPLFSSRPRYNRMSFSERIMSSFSMTVLMWTFAMVDKHLQEKSIFVWTSLFFCGTKYLLRYTDQNIPPTPPLQFTEMKTSCGVIHPSTQTPSSGFRISFSYHWHFWLHHRSLQNS